MNQSCPLCHHESPKLFYSQQNPNWRIYAKSSESSRLDFFKCNQCALIYKDRTVTLALDDQKLRYLEHENQPSLAYKNFLLKLWYPLEQCLGPGQNGLDFGCGPTKVLQDLAAQRGYQCDSYDPLFWPDKALLNKTYDFVYCSEVVEHFVCDNVDWKQLRSLVKPRGHIGIMTSFPPVDFEKWYYHRDATHVSFYCPETFDWIATHFDFQIVSCRNNVTVLLAS